MQDDHFDSSVEDYLYDVFISYRRIEFGLEWVADLFEPMFRQRLAVSLGETPRIFFDETSIEAGMIPEPKLKTAIRASKCMISIWSRPYFTSPWCLAELETFLQRAEVTKLAERGESLTIPLQWQDGDSYSAHLTPKFPKPIDFKKFRRTSPGFRQTPDFDEFEIALNKLADRVAKLIDTAPPFHPDWPLVLPTDITIDPEPQSRSSWRL